VTQARRRSSTPAIAVAQVHVRRAYTDGRYGQLHLTTAYPSGGGFDERSPLVCLHSAHAAGTSFRTLLPELGKDRSVYAPDLPGHGQSDPVAASGPGNLGLADYIAAIGDFFDSMRLRAVDLLGHGMGAVVAVELAVLRPQQVRRVVLVPGEEPIRTPKGELRVGSVQQPTLLLYPAESKAQRPDLKTQHTAMALKQPAAEILGGGAAETARLLRDFLDR
jgi:pimeloyl-ACP methyl ester carboxylesterase